MPVLMRQEFAGRSWDRLSCFKAYIKLNKLTCNVVVAPDHRLHHKVTMTTRLTSDRLQHSWICHMSLGHLCTYCKNKQFDREYIKYF